MWAVIRLLILFIAIIVCAKSTSASDDASFVLINGTDVTLGNRVFNITFGSNGIAKTLYKNGTNLVANILKPSSVWYLDWNGGKGFFHPSQTSVISNSSEEAHVAFIQEASSGLLHLELHLVVLPNVSGIYQYVKASNPTDAAIGIGEFRTVYRFDHSLMPKLTNMVTSGNIPSLKDRPTIQDSTWQIEDGSYWSKYDLCGYIRETPWFGVYGGGFGGWVLSASREYHSGGPLKQDLLVHHDSLMLNYFHSGHFGTPGLDTPPGWSKFYGPYLIYINTGSEDEVQKDAARQALIEQAQWPYSWVEDDEYPIKRGSVSGIVSGQTKAMVVVYDSVQEQFDLQTLGYLYHTETDENGTFTIHNIRPGNYQIVAYPLAGQGSENLARKNVSVSAGELQDVGTLNLPEPTGILWSIGETNRRADTFRYSDEPRNFYWHLLPPRNLTFEIGKSDPTKNWYYSQSEGIWNIVYEDQPDDESRQLRVALAAASGSLIFNITTVNLQVEVNEFTIGDFEYENDHTVYRDALQNGNFSAEQLTVPADKVVKGKNKISLKVLRGSVMYDAISLAKDSK